MTRSSTPTASVMRASVMAIPLATRMPQQTLIAWTQNAKPTLSATRATAKETAKAFGWQTVSHWPTPKVNPTLSLE